MTVATNTNRKVFNGTGSTGPFTFSFRFFQDGDIQVTRVSAAGIATVLAQGADYDLSGAGSYQGGSITLTVALAIGEQLIAFRLIDILQETCFRNLGAFFPEMHEDSFDKITMILQQLADQATRAIKLPADVWADGELPFTPLPDTLLGFDGLGKLTLKTASYTVSVTMGAGAAPTVIYADASAGPTNVNLPANGEVIIIKTDVTANPATIIGTGGKTVMRIDGANAPWPALTEQDTTIHLVMNGTNWYRI